MGRLHQLVSVAVIGCAAAVSTSASAFAPPRLPRLAAVDDARIVCDEFDRCFRIGPYGRRVFLPPGAVYPGGGAYGYGYGYGGPPDRGFDGPPGRGFGRDGGAPEDGPPDEGGPRRGFGGDEGRDRGALREGGEDGAPGDARRPRRRDDSPGLRQDQGPGGAERDSQFGGGRNRFGEGGDGGQRARRGYDQFGEDNGEARRPRRQPGDDDQFGGPRGGGPRVQQDEGGQ